MQNTARVITDCFCITYLTSQNLKFNLFACRPFLTAHSFWFYYPPAAIKLWLPMLNLGNHFWTQTRVLTFIILSTFSLLKFSSCLLPAKKYLDTSSVIEHVDFPFCLNWKKPEFYHPLTKPKRLILFNRLLSRDRNSFSPRKPASFVPLFYRK